MEGSLQQQTPKEMEMNNCSIKLGKGIPTQEDDIDIVVKANKDGSFYERHEDTIALDATLRRRRNSKVDGSHNSADQEDSPGGTFGTAFGVFLPCLQNILGVILFIRLPWIVAQAGMVYSTFVIIICVVSTVLTTLSMSALATNGKIKAGGPYAILLSNLGPEFAGSIGILFYLGTTIAGTMYALGGVEAMVKNFGSGEQYFSFDREIISFGWTIMLGLIVFAGMKWVAKISFFFLLIVFSAILFMTLGTILFAATVWDPTGILHPANLNENMWDNYTKDPETGVTPSFTSLIALFYPSVTGIMAGSNRSGVLRSPGQSIPRGTLGAITTTTSLYIITVWLFGLSVANSTLMENKLVASYIAWPHQYVVGVGIIMSCVGAGLQSLAGAPQLLKSIANDGHIPFLKIFGTEHPEDEPRRAVVFTTSIAAVCCFAGNLDYITPIITMFFLSMYGAINLACFLSGFLESPSFRPTWKYFHWSTALFGFLVCTVIMFVISVLYAFIALILVCVIYYYIRANREKKEWGSALFGLRLNQAMDSLLDLSEISRQNKAKRKKWSWKNLRRKKKSKESPSFGAVGGPEDEDENDFYDEDEHPEAPNQNNWRPQVLVLCKLVQHEDESRLKFTTGQPALLQLASQLKKGRGLTIVSSILHGDVLDPTGQKKQNLAKRYLEDQLARRKVRGFSEVVLGSGSNMLETFRILFQSKGLGMLAPNTVMAGWPTKWRGASDNKEEEGGAHMNTYVQMLKDAIGCRKALIVVKSDLLFPTLPLDDGATLDVWWLIHDGDMLVLLPYLLRRHKVWEKSKLRIFAIADDLVDIQASHRILETHLSELRITAQISIIHVGASHARDVDQNRTVRIPASPQVESSSSIKVKRQNSILGPDMFKPLVDGIDDDDDGANITDLEVGSPGRPSKDLVAHLASSTGEETKKWIKKKYEKTKLTSMFDICEKTNPAPASDPAATTAIEENMEDAYAPENAASHQERARALRLKKRDHVRRKKRLVTAAYLNEKIREHSQEAALVVLNLPLSRGTPTEEFVLYTEQLTSGLQRVIMLRGHGTENVKTVN